MTEPGRELCRQRWLADGLALAERLIGKTLVRRTPYGEMRGVITETEAYMGVCDRASHAYGGRRTARTETMYMDGGHAYVYLIYGMYNCMNITANIRGVPEAVLIRAVYPTLGVDLFYDNYISRGRRKSLARAISEMTPREIYSLSNGPGKLCVSMDIDRRFDGCDITSGELCVIDEGFVPKKILCAPRIGIDYAGEDAKKPWRFTALSENGVPAIFRG